jgi:multiple sugar transport system permease protein
MAKKQPVNREINYATRVDKVSSKFRVARTIKAIFTVVVAIIMLIPVIWMGMTAFKSRPDAVSVPPKVIFKPTFEGFIGLISQTRQVGSAQGLEDLKNDPDLKWYDRVMLNRGQQIVGSSEYVGHLKNSAITAGVSTLLSVALGLFSAYAFSRFPVPGKDDLLFFILSTRMLPPVVVTIPIFLIYRELGLYDSTFGLILLYTVFNLSFSVWLMQGFIDEIPKEYEEAALVDGYSRFQAFFKIVLPQAITGIAATTVFCFIFAWNEYAFSVMLTAQKARTAPPSITSALGTGSIEWAEIAAGAMGFLIPVAIVTFALRNYLLRGVTFGAVRR